MNLRKFIDMLEAEYEQQMQYSDVMGEPEIVIDLFKESDYCSRKYEYAGFTTQYIVIDNTSDGCYRVITAFADVYPKELNDE